MKRIIRAWLLIATLAITGSGAAFAATTPTLNQTISDGTLSTDILDASRASVASPSATLTAKTYSFDCQVGGSASTGTLGSTNQRAYVMNPGAADGGWTLTIAATGGAGAEWTNGSDTFDFNDVTDSGCTDGADTTDTTGGQLTIDPSAGTLAADCADCTVANVPKGSSASFAEGTTDSVTLLSAAGSSDDVWRGYLYGSALSQTVPAEQPAGSYSLNMTLTVTAS